MKKSLITLSVALALAACGQDETRGLPQANSIPVKSTQSTPAQAVPQQSQQHAQEQGSSWMPALIGGAVGYMLGSSTSSNNSQPRVIEREVVRNVYTPRPAPAAVPKPAPVQTPKFSAPIAPKPYVAPTPSQRPSYSGPSSYKSPTYSYRPSSSRSFGKR